MNYFSNGQLKQLKQNSLNNLSQVTNGLKDILNYVQSGGNQQQIYKYNDTNNLLTDNQLLPVNQYVTFQITQQQYTVQLPQLSQSQNVILTIVNDNDSQFNLIIKYNDNDTDTTTFTINPKNDITLINYNQQIWEEYNDNNIKKTGDQIINGTLTSDNLKSDSLQCKDNSTQLNIGTDGYNVKTIQIGNIGDTVNIQGQINIQNLELRLQQQEPIGCVKMWGGSQNNIPDTYLQCNGQEVLKVDYQDLYNIIQNLYGVASDNTKFKVPNCNGMFVKGPNSQIVNGITYNGGNSVGGTYNHKLEEHNHKYNDAYATINNDNIIHTLKTVAQNENGELYQVSGPLNNTTDVENDDFADPPRWIVGYGNYIFRGKNGGSSWDPINEHDKVALHTQKYGSGHITEPGHVVFNYIIKAKY